ETRRCFVSSALRRARLHCDAECVDFSDYLSVDLTGDGSDARLRLVLECVGALATKRVFVDQPATGAFLLRVISGDRLDLGVFCVPAGATRTLATVVVVVSTKILLSPGDVLRDDQIGGDGDSWSSGRLGQVGTQSHGGGWTVATKRHKRNKCFN